MAKVSIRECIRSDFEVVAKLLEDIGRPASTPDKAVEMRDIFWAHVDKAETSSLLAFLDDEPIGFLALEIRYRLNYVNREAWISAFVVKEAARGHGIAAQLFEKAAQTATQRGCFRLVLESMGDVPDDFYQQKGMQRVGRAYHLLIESGS